MSGSERQMQRAHLGSDPEGYKMMGAPATQAQMCSLSRGFRNDAHRVSRIVKGSTACGRCVSEDHR